MEIKLRSEQRDEQHYVAIRRSATLQQLSTDMPKLIPEVAQWLGSKNLKPSDAPFFHYRNMDGSHFDVEVGFPVAESTEGDERVKPGKFEAGKYAVATYIGPYSQLHIVHKTLEDWAKENNIKINGPGTEFYPTGPATEPDPNKWQTDIVARIPDEDKTEIKPQTILVK